MTQYFMYLLSIFLFISCFYRVDSFVQDQMVGDEAARRNLRHVMILFLFFLLGLLLFSIILIKVESCFLSIVVILYTVHIWTELIICFVRQKQAGTLLANIGKNSRNKLVLGVGLVLTITVILQTGLFLMSVFTEIPKDTNLALEISILIAWWSFGISSITRGMNGLEFREHGICFMYSLLKWEIITSYAWEAYQPTVLILLFTPQFSMFSGCLRLRIPEKYKNLVSHILEEKLPSKSCYE